MDKICKVYVSQVKAMLPVFGKKEKTFIKKLRGDLSDYCEDNNVNTIEELYNGYGKPQEIVFEYISLMEPDVISKRINISKYIKFLVVSLITLAFLATTFLGFYTYSEYKIAEELGNITVEHVIRESN